MTGVSEIRTASAPQMVTSPVDTSTKSTIPRKRIVVIEYKEAQTDARFFSQGRDSRSDITRGVKPRAGVGLCRVFNDKGKWLLISGKRVEFLNEGSYHLQVISYS